MFGSDTVDPQLAMCIYCALSMCDKCLFLTRWCGHACRWLSEETSERSD